MIYENDNIRISIITTNGKKELVIEYYRAGFYLGTMTTDDLEDMNKITIKLAG